MVRKENIHGDIIYRNEQGEFHRENGPAIKYSDGGKAWFINGKRHRVHEPAEDYPGGSKAWWKNGLRHRVGGPAQECANGDKYWWKNNKRHRLNAPAIIDKTFNSYSYYEFGIFIK